MIGGARSFSDSSLSIRRMPCRSFLYSIKSSETLHYGEAMRSEDIEVHDDGLDPVYRTARHEATIILSSWLVCQTLSAQTPKPPKNTKKISAER